MYIGIGLESDDPPIFGVDAEIDDPADATWAMCGSLSEFIKMVGSDPVDE